LPCVIFPGTQVDETLDRLKVEAWPDLRNLVDVSTPPDFRLHRSVVGNALADLVASSEPDVMQVWKGSGEHLWRRGPRQAEGTRGLRGHVTQPVPHELRPADAPGRGAL